MSRRSDSRYSREVDPVLHQRGANGLIAEYQCALTLNESLEAATYETIADSAMLTRARDATVRRVANELTPAQVTRAMAQGDALARHILEGIMSDPLRLGLHEIPVSELARAKVSVETIGHNTNSGTSADLSVRFVWPDGAVDVPISLKAYGKRSTSLGSKGAKASLSRVFLNAPLISDEEFVDYFGEAASHFQLLLLDFKAAAHEFYSSPDGAAFVRAYQERKRLPTSARVNNPLRRKEVGDYFIATRGFVPEHRFAELYVKMFDIGVRRLRDGGDQDWAAFLNGFRFVLGMEGDILTLNAVADDRTGRVLRVENSFLSDAYAQIRRVLVPGCDVTLTHRPGSSVVGVELGYGSARVRCLSLAIWKDATIQFKLDSRVVS